MLRININKVIFYWPTIAGTMGRFKILVFKATGFADCARLSYVYPTWEHAIKVCDEANAAIGMSRADVLAAISATEEDFLKPLMCPITDAEAIRFSYVANDNSALVLGRVLVLGRPTVGIFYSEQTTEDKVSLYPLYIEPVGVAVEDMLIQF